MIGRQGIVIKSMSEQSNCQMQLAEMNDPYDTKERIMVINGKNGQIKDLIQVSSHKYHTKHLMTYD
jgi:KH domain